MDGNGRWANQRFRPRIWGHVRGTAVVSEIVQAADDAGIKALTLYAFSTENWSRPLEEVSTLFRLLKKFLLREKQRILSNKFLVCPGWKAIVLQDIFITKKLLKY